jgi:hypothetical protein
MTRPSSSRLGSSFSTSAMDRFSSGSNEGGFRLFPNHQISRWDAGLTKGTTSAEGSNSSRNSNRSSPISESGNSLRRNAGWEPTTSTTTTTTTSEPHTQQAMTMTDLRCKNKNRLQTLELSRPTIPTTSSSTLRKATGAPLKHHHQQQQQRNSDGRRNSESNRNDRDEQQQTRIIPNATWMPLTMPQRSPDNQIGNNAAAGSTVDDPSSSTGCRWSIPQRKSDSNLIYPKRVTG